MNWILHSATLRRLGYAIAIAAAIILIVVDFAENGGDSPMESREYVTIALPEPKRDGVVSVERALQSRRSVRDFGDHPITMEDLSQLLWAAQGITSPDGFRTAPSAGALYPLEIYVVVGNVRNLQAGVYKFDPARNALLQVGSGDRREAIAKAALQQAWIAKAAAILAIVADVSRTAGKYGKRAERYVHVEAGAAVQNVYLQAVVLGLGTTVVGALSDDEAKHLLAMPAGEDPVVLMPIGHPE